MIKFNVINFSTEAVAQTCSVKKVFLEISQIINGIFNKIVTKVSVKQF